MEKLMGKNYHIIIIRNIIKQNKENKENSIKKANKENKANRNNV